MPKIKLTHTVSCSSEDTTHVANNLLNNDTNKKWKSKGVGESSIIVIFQLEKACKISAVDIGNENSSFVEVLVGRSSSQDDYQILLAMSSFMTPIEARNLTNSNRVRIFTYNDLASPARDEKWDRVKIVCSQPFNKHLQYGLSFITLHSPEETKTEDKPLSFGKFTLRPDSPDFLTAGSTFARRKELAAQNPPDNNLTQEIRNATSGFKCKSADIRSPKITKTGEDNRTEETRKNRNRTDLFYDSDDDKASEKIQKAIENAKTEKTPNKTGRKKKDDNDTGQKSEVKKKQRNTASPSATPSTSSSKRKLNNTPKLAQKKPKLEPRPFYELLQGVVFTISGIVNPERANLRQLALNMGAKYKPDWDNTCTHLICAFAHTPKFQQVQGKGKIVKKSWIQECHSQRKRLPWRRYALDKNDQGKPESEDEICERINEPEPIEDDEIVLDSPEPNQNKNIGSVSGGDTDDEIEKILAKHKAEKNYDAFNAETDEERLEKEPKEVVEFIPKIFTTEIFYIDDVFDEDEKSTLLRLVKAANGTVLSHVGSTVDFIITKEESVGAVKERSTSATCVTPSWIYECYNMRKLVPFDKYIIL